MKFKEMEKKRILILGFGQEGKNTLYFLRKLFPKLEIGIADRDERVKDPTIKNVKWYLGQDYLEAIEKYDLLIKSPGIPIHLPQIEKAFKEGKITSQTEIFLQNCKGTIVGVTATKGKSTTSRVIYQILKESGAKVHLVGNIGNPPLKYLLSPTENKIFVFEMSSHQLYGLKKSPQIAVWLNIFPEHLDYYKSFKEYLRAKANICLWQKEGDFFIYNFNDREIRKIAKKTTAKKIPIKNPLKILSDYQIKITPMRAHFALNLAAAIKVGEILKIKRATIKRAILNFQFLPHRLEFVGTFKGIQFYNDSLSTIPETTLQALNTLGNKVTTLILGGFDRGLDFSNLAKEIIKRKIKTLILFPETGERIWREILKITKDEKLPKAFLVQNMKDAVKIAFQTTKKGEICLLSPASPSFGLFQNYKERGNLFKKYVRYYGTY